jgi:hypothetical protein
MSGRITEAWAPVSYRHAAAVVSLLKESATCGLGAVAAGAAPAETVMFIKKAVPGGGREEESNGGE